MVSSSAEGPADLQPCPTRPSVAHILCSGEEVKASSPQVPLTTPVQGIPEQAMLDAAKPECVS